ncbi:MAG: AN1-type zinc finger protein [Candidatus Hodarchaeales archaeon]|jgi:hypothetical protein
MKATREIRDLVFGYVIIFLLIAGIKVIFFPDSNRNLYLITTSLISTVIAFRMIQLMFASHKIKGTDRTYVVAPDLSIKKEVLDTKVVIPEEALCHKCNRNVYKPFLCPDCKQLFCGEHSLPSYHECRSNSNIK